MKIKTINELNDKLDSDLYWRRKELTLLKSDIKKSERAEKEMLIRAGIALLYAHWEGFIKNSAEYYLQYIVSKRLSLNELCPGLLTIALKKKLNEFVQSRKISNNLKLVEYFLYNLEERANLSSNIDTKSNLNSSVFRDIILSIGLIYRPEFEVRSQIIDSKLLNNRNIIAHGNYLSVDEKEFLEVHDEIFKIIDIFKIDILNSAILESYKIHSE